MDADGDGVADSRSTVLSGLSYPFGLAFRGDTMYFAEQTAVKRLDPGATTPVTLIANLPGGGHVTRTIAFGPDNLLYVAIGSSCNVCDDALPRAAVIRYNLDGSNPHPFATGLRNSVGLAFHPTTGELWANNNDRDNLGDDVPPEHLNILRDGRWYGWPQCYLPGEANPEYPGADCSGVEPPALTFQAHSAPLGLAFYTGAMFPAEYRGDAFMTYHGSWNRTVATGAKVVRVRVENGRPAAIEDFVTGWQLADGSRWGRPVGLLVMPDGALLVSDDGDGRIWRVSFGQGPPVEGTGDLTVTTSTTGSGIPAAYTLNASGPERDLLRDCDRRLHGVAIGCAGELRGERRQPADGDRPLRGDGLDHVRGELHGDDGQSRRDDDHDRFQSRSRWLYGRGGWRSRPGDRDQQHGHVQRARGRRPQRRAYRRGGELQPERRDVSDRDRTLGRDGYRVLLGELCNAQPAAACERRVG